MQLTLKSFKPYHIRQSVLADKGGVEHLRQHCLIVAAHAVGEWTVSG